MACVLPLPLREGVGEGARDRANAEQLQASDPSVSAFVGASAGSGKTKLLTDRLLRLMLAGAAPERIQCLTFTKAAAAEMAVRLQKTLGKWVTLDDAALARRTAARCASHHRTQTLATARALFAHVLDLPGGMRIGTIHAFCQSLLRRFPLEASLSPHFRLVDDRDAEDALTEARENMLAHASAPRMRAALDTLAGLASADQFGTHVASLQRDLPRLKDALALGDSARGRAAPRTRRDRGDGGGDHRACGELAGGARRCARRRGSSSDSARRRAPSARSASSIGSGWKRRSAASTGRTGARSSSPRTAGRARRAVSRPRR